MTLYELTKHEWGIILFKSGEIIVANWIPEQEDMLPMLSPFGYALINFPLPKGTIAKAESTRKYIPVVLKELAGKTIVYDPDRCIERHAADVSKGQENSEGFEYTLDDGTKILTVCDWE